METLRKWMINDGLWLGSRVKKSQATKIDPLVAAGRIGAGLSPAQAGIDGSPHDGFEGRAPRCTLIAFIHDASSRLLTLHFSPTETTPAYMETLDQQLDKQGRPGAIYSDKHSIFRVNHPDKGRVERANKTLQDRLLKEMRLQNIHSIEQANAFLPQFIDDYNRRFAVTALTAFNLDNAHRAVLTVKKNLNSFLADTISVNGQKT